MPTPFTHFTQSALSLRNFTQLYTALRISTHFTHFTQSSKTLGTLRTLRNLRELTYFKQLYSALRKAKILYSTLRGGETLYASFTRRLRKVHLLYAHFTHTLRNFTQFNALYARPDYFTQLYAHGNLLMSVLSRLHQKVRHHLFISCLSQPTALLAPPAHPRRCACTLLHTHLSLASLRRSSPAVPSLTPLVLLRLLSSAYLNGSLRPAPSSLARTP